MKNFSKISLAAISCLTFSVSARAEQSKGMNACQFEKPSDAQVFELGNPQVYQLKSLQADRAATSFVVRLRGDGVGVLKPLEQIPPLQELNLVKVKEILGEPASSNASAVEATDEYVFNLITVGVAEPEIFHIDMKAPKGGNLISYRVRGCGISNPNWLKIQ